MDPTLIKPFISSIQNVFTTMLQLQVTINDPYIKTNNVSNDVSGIIGMSGDVVGTVVLGFPTSTAENCVALFVGQKIDPATADFADAIGELINMVCGGAKAMFKNRKASISCPSVVMGCQHVLARQSEAATIVIPCQTDCGPFTIEVTIKAMSPVASESPATASATAN